MTSESSDVRAGHTFRGRPGAALLSGRQRLLRGAFAVSGAIALAACSTPAPAATTTTSPSPSPTSDSRFPVVFSMDFDQDALLASEPSGAAKVTQESFFGGMLKLVSSNSGSGLAIQFPAFSDEEEEPGVGLVAMAGSDPLPNPGTAAFEFGADILFDEIAASSNVDNGDNVIQRGLAADPSQFKLQVDKGVPSCTVTGTDGRLIVKGELLEAATWYRMSCLLDDAGLQLTVTDLDASEDAEFVVAGAVGDVTFTDDVPIAIGRKAGANGVGVKKQPDQFNGTMDSIWVAIDESR